MSLISHAQQIDNKVNIYCGYGFGSFYGKEMITEDNFISPSLFANYQNLSGISLKGLVSGNKILGFGLGLDYLTASQWELQGYIDYSKSGVNLYSISPVIQFHTKYTERELTNRIKAFFEIAPTIGLSKLTLSTPLFDIQSEEIFSQPLESNAMYYGVKGNAGLEIIITRAIGLSLSYSYQQSWVSSIYYPDKHFANSLLNFGIFLRLKKDQRYFY